MPYHRCGPKYVGPMNLMMSLPRPRTKTRSPTESLLPLMGVKNYHRSPWSYPPLVINYETMMLWLVRRCWLIVTCEDRIAIVFERKRKPKTATNSSTQKRSWVIFIASDMISKMCNLRWLIFLRIPLRTIDVTLYSMFRLNSHKHSGVQGTMKISDMVKVFRIAVHSVVTMLFNLISLSIYIPFERINKTFADISNIPAIKQLKQVILF